MTTEMFGLRVPRSPVPWGCMAWAIGLLLLCLGPHARAQPAPEAQAPTVHVAVEVDPPELAEKLTRAVDIGREEHTSRLTPSLLRALHARAINQLTSALRSYGYYQAEVVGELRQEADTWHAQYRVDKGAPTTYRRVTVNVVGAGEAEPALRRAVTAFPVTVGTVVDHEQYETGKTRLLKRALDLGYLDAEFSIHEIRIAEKRDVADLDLVLDSGPKFTFGEVTLVQDAFHPEFLKKYVEIKPGEPYSAKKVLELESVFRDTEYFDSIEVTPELDGAVANQNQVPITVRLRPAKPSAYSFGLGFGTDSGVRGKAGWVRRRVNRRGHRFEAELRASQIQQSISGQYIIPFRKPSNDRLAIIGGYTNDEPDNSSSEVSRLGIRRTTVRGYTTKGYSLVFHRESFTVSDVSDTTDLLMPGIELARTRSDNRLFPTRGNQISMQVRGGLSGVLSDISFAQVLVQGKLIRSPWTGGRVLLRAEAGYTQNDELDELPATIRFFTGGDQSVRGYGFNDLGVTDENGDVVGGRHLLVGSVEYDHAINDRFSLAAFLDTGNAINALNDGLEQGAGLGVRWKSPVGPVRLDVASAISRPGNPIRLHISVGPDL